MKLNFNLWSAEASEETYELVQEMQEECEMRVLLVEQPDGGSSLGDHAQTIAIKKWLKEQYRGVEVKDFSLRDAPDEVLSVLKPNDILMFHSGGNFGDCYGGDEANRQRLILKAKRNKVVILPKTLRFVNEDAVEVAENVYNSHRDLTLCCRDLESYRFAQKHFGKARLVACPDFALTLKPKLRHYKREGVLGLFRRDPETLGYQKYVEYVDEEKDFVFRPFLVSNKIRDFTLKHFLNALQKYRAVVTDRMHGVYFSLITGTPCVAVPQKLGKTESMMEWFKNVDYVKYVKSADEVPEALEQVCNAPKDLTFLAEWRTWFKDELKRRFYTDEPVNPKHLFSLIKNRRSIRHWYPNYPVGDETLRKILEAGAYAPCGANDQRIRLRLIEKGSTVRRFCRLKDDWAHNSFPSCIVLVLFDLKPKGSCNNGEVEPMWERLVWQDSAAATMNMSLMAESYGVSSCWITLAQSELEHGVRELLNISSRYVICNALFLGYSPVAEKTRRLLPTLHWYGRKVQRNLERIVL
jgi:pyruvyl transferase EpsI